MKWKAHNENEYKKLHLEKTTTYGNEKLLGLSMPFVDVEDLGYEHVQPDQYIFFAILRTLYRGKVHWR